MRKIKILSRKFDGSLRDEYETNLFKETDGLLITCSPPGLKSWDYRQSSWSESSDGLIEIYSKTKWYQVWHIVERVRSSIKIYVHIALPATLNAQLLEWTDLDLDYRVHLDNSIELKDQEEFEQNIERMPYPSWLVEKAWEACREVKEGLERGTFPFDHGNQVDLYHRIKRNLNLDRE